MSIKPFVDRPKINIGQAVTITPVTGGMNTSEINRFRQGVSIRDMSDFRCTLVPIITSKGFTHNAGARMDFSLNKSDYGQPKLFEDLGNDGPFNGIFSPFDDIVGRWSAKEYLEDTGTQMYPNVMMSPNWLDPAMMDGVIDPLEIRHKMSNANAEGPFPAHDVRGSLMPNVGNEILGRGVFVNSVVPFCPEASNPPYIDSQDIAMELVSPDKIDGVTLFISFPGFDYPEETSIEPFDDNIFATDIENQQFDVLNTISGSIGDAGEFGIYQKSATVGFIYRTGNYIINQDVLQTGARRVMGTDSIAFGGLLK